VRLVAAWGLLTAFGWLLFGFLLRRVEGRRRPGHAERADRPASPVVAGAPALPAAPSAAARAAPSALGPMAQATDAGDASTPPAASPVARRVREDEKNLPRWLRPSVQAARHGVYHPSAGHGTTGDD
jgi:hypothetical protein